MISSIPSVIEVTAVLDEAARTAVFSLQPGLRLPGKSSRQWVVSLGGRVLARFPADMLAPVSAVVPLAELYETAHGLLEIHDDQGKDVSDWVQLKGEGELFAALRIGSAEEFFTRLQQHHTRFRSLFLLELGARLAFGSAWADYRVRASALTIIAHRYLERLPGRFTAQDERRLDWLMDAAEKLLPEGEAALLNGPLDWEIARWTTSLATVCGYIALIRQQPDRAREFFAVHGRQTGTVEVARVSALNLVVGCFMHGLLSHLAGRTEDARRSLIQGLETVKPSVQAQDLLENVWVIGDLMNVMAVGRQCFIALVRLRLLHSDPRQPVLDADASIEPSAVTGPLQKLLEGGYVPELEAHLLRYRSA
ncbi:hypothetical protein [Roseococcus microcysteis]|uniref:hypothetical protein n=1 Tax=Roseococcus microcysteis TaxID=2771361 RepID=UPI00168B995A|nr:hypothetical protein [Roseococcus microcysteis]